MTFAPPKAIEAAAYLVSRGFVNLGIVGDTGHVAKGISYHLGKDQLATGAYSAKTLRDRQGLTNAASALDIGHRSRPALRSFSSLLVDHARQDAPGTSDWREVIYSPDGVKVLRWDRERGYASAPKEGEADASHLTHTHVSWYRDSEKRDKVAAFRGVLEMAYMKPAGVPIGTFRVTGDNHWFLDTGNTRIRYGPQPDGRTLPVIASVNLTDSKGVPMDIEGRQPPLSNRNEVYLLDMGAGAAVYALRVDGLFTSTDPTPYSQADIDALKASATVAVVFE